MADAQKGKRGDQYPDKPSIVDNDRFNLFDSADLDASSRKKTKSFSFATLKTSLKVFFDTLYSSGKIAMQVTIPGNAYVADNIVYMRVPYDFTLSFVRLGAGGAPTDDVLTGAVSYHATNPVTAKYSVSSTIFTTGPETNAPSIASTNFTDDSGAPDVTALVKGGWVWFSVKNIGSNLPGADVVFELLQA